MEAIIAAQFKLGKQLGNGAFGIIYEGTCIATDRKVAIKMVRQSWFDRVGVSKSTAKPDNGVRNPVTPAGRT